VPASVSFTIQKDGPVKAEEEIENKNSKAPQRNHITSEFMVNYIRGQRLTFKMMNAIKIPVFRHLCAYSMLKLTPRNWSVARYG
jgi:hypothetical protein